MNENLRSESIALRHVIHTFIDERKQAKLKAKPDDRDKIETAFSPHVWLDDAARRVDQITLATHTLKPIHPDARGSTIYASGYVHSAAHLVGSHCLSAYTDDVVGNAAALDVFKLLKLTYDGQTLLSRILTQDPAIASALSEDAEHAQRLMQAFAGIVQNKAAPTSHTLAKQLYFPTSDADQPYHLLAPLFPTSLVHHVHQTIRQDRFGEDARAAREARHAELFHPYGYREYPDLVIQNFGGTKPQNISQLNSERYGENWLLPSLPPSWSKQDPKPPAMVRTVFGAWLLRRREVYEAVTALRDFLHRLDHTDYTNVRIRNTRDALVMHIIDEVLLMASQLRDLPAGWSDTANAKLDEAEALWLDPERCNLEGQEEFHQAYLWADWVDEIPKRFAAWLTHAIQNKKRTMGDNETHEWQRALEQAMSLLTRELKS